MHVHTGFDGFMHRGHFWAVLYQPGWWQLPSMERGSQQHAGPVAPHVLSSGLCYRIEDRQVQCTHFDGYASCI